VAGFSSREESPNRERMSSQTNIAPMAGQLKVPATAPAKAGIKNICRIVDMVAVLLL
jgi:hypothetical protein